MLNVYQLLTTVVSPVADFGDLSSSVHGFLFTVTNQLPNKSLPDLMFVYSFLFVCIFFCVLRSNYETFVENCMKF